VQDNEFNVYINIQIEPSQYAAEELEHVYAIAMSVDDLDMTDFVAQQINPGKLRDITDILIQIKDILIVIEVKRTEEDCKAQLLNQVKNLNQNIITPKSFSWKNLINIFNKLKALRLGINQPSIFLDDFLDLIYSRFSSWFPDIPFNTLPFATGYISPAAIRVNARLEKAIKLCCQKYGYSRLEYHDRDGFHINFGWAVEFIPEFEIIEDKEYLVCKIWPGNTKGQGDILYAKDPDLKWIHKNSLDILGSKFPLWIKYHIKLTHATRYISHLDFNEDPVILKKPLYTFANHKSNAGIWKREDDKYSWQYFEALMDNHFIDPLFWRTELKWQQKFLTTGRKHLGVAFGFVLSLGIPYEDLKQLDKKQGDINKVADLLHNSVIAMQNII
jgi:hypothetical protein